MVKPNTNCMSTSHITNPSYQFTFQEIKVIVLIKQGHSNQQISERLHIAVCTVKTHRKNILKKIGLKGKTRNYTFDIIYPTKILLISYLGRIVAQSYN